MRRRLSLLLIVLLAARSLLPAGFMLAPVAAADGKIAIVICTGHGAETITLDEHGAPQPAKGQKDNRPLCPFASTGAVALGGGEPAMHESPVLYAAVRYRSPDDLVPISIAARARLARGPPSSLT